MSLTNIGIRVPVTIGGFIDAFFNEHTGTIEFVLVQNGSRIFGADNTGGWPLHTFENPDQHQPLTAEMSVAEFVAAIEKQYLAKD